MFGGKHKYRKVAVVVSEAINEAIIEAFKYSSKGYKVIPTDYTITADDWGYTLLIYGPVTITLPAILNTKFWFQFRNKTGDLVKIVTSGNSILESVGTDFSTQYTTVICEVEAIDTLPVPPETGFTTMDFARWHAEGRED